jgi:hypothetical protein
MTPARYQLCLLLMVLQELLTAFSSFNLEQNCSLWREMTDNNRILDHDGKDENEAQE